MTDMVTGTEHFVYEFSEYEGVERIWELEENVFAVLVGLEDLWVREARLRALEGNFSTNNIEVDFVPDSERNFRLMLFDNELNRLETLEGDLGFLRVSHVLLRLEDGNVVAYRWSHTESGEDLDLLRMDLRTGEVETLFVGIGDVGFTLWEFVGEDLIVLSGRFFDTVPDKMYYGVLDLGTGEIHLAEAGAIMVGQVVENGDSVIFTEVDVRVFDIALFDEVLVFNFQSLEGVVVNLFPEDSLWARLTLDGKYVVTVNLGESIFRKYDLSGSIVAEVPLTIDFPERLQDVGIVPLTENYFVIVVLERFGGRTFQVVRLEEAL